MHKMKQLTRSLVLALLTSFLIIPASVNADGRQIALGISQIDDQNLAAVEANRAAVGRYPAIWTVWSDWGGGDKDFPSGFIGSLRGLGITPMVNWQPIAPESVADCSLWSLDTIINGNHDAYIREWAMAAAASGGTVLVRLMHEMNGYWFIWGWSRCTNTPEKFKQAWIHVWNIFRDVGATNVKFVWSIYGAFKLAEHYPGDQYVDYIGFTAFNWGPPTHKWSNDMLKHFKSPIKAIRRQVSKTKPMIAAEMGSAVAPANCRICDKAKYIRNGYPKVWRKWANLVAIVYFDIDMTALNVSQPNWRLDSPPSALASYAQIAAMPQFQGRIP